MFFPITPSFSGALPLFDTTLTYSSDTADVNIFTAAGSPGGVVNVRVNVEASADIYASTTGNYAMDCDGFAAGSLIYIFCDGRICGKGGAVASGGSGTSNGSAGNAGGPALRLGAETVISGSGSINGGGGGGGGAGGTRNSVVINPEIGCEIENLSGGSGGAGESYDSAAGSGTTGTNGSSGGAGGAFGAAGSNGQNGATGVDSDGCTGAGQGSGGSGGAAGKAIEVNGQSYSNSVTTNGTVS